MSFKEKWQKRGREAVVAFGEREGLEVELFPYRKRNQERGVLLKRLAQTFFTDPVVVVLRIWRPDANNYDVHNPYIKPVLDGFTHGRLWEDDGCHYVPTVISHFEGIDRRLAFTATEREQRAERQARHIEQRVNRGLSEARKRMPVRARFRFEFYVKPQGQQSLF